MVQSLHLYALSRRACVPVGTHRETARVRVRVEPFEAIELELSALWAT